MQRLNALGPSAKSRDNMPAILTLHGALHGRSKAN